MRALRERVPEPMVMDDAEAVAAFHVEHPVLQAPVYRRNAEALSALLPPGGRLLDLGSGSGRLLMTLARARPDVRITGLDLAPRMVEVGRAALAAAGLADRVTLAVGDMTALGDAAEPPADVVSCMWALHHLPSREHAVRCLQEMAAVRVRHGAAVWLFDMVRLPDAAAFPALVGAVPDVPPRLRDDGIASEAAAWTVDEVRAMLEEAGLGEAEGGTDPDAPFLQAWRLPATSAGQRPGSTTV